MTRLDGEDCKLQVAREGESRLFGDGDGERERCVPQSCCTFGLDALPLSHDSMMRQVKWGSLT